VIIRQGELGDRFYLLESGEVEILREEQGRPEHRLAVRRASEFFGEIALLQDVKRTATVRCLTPVDVVSVTRQDFHLLVASSPTFRQQFT
jgi:CRP-like cAMP-binding protein